MGKVSYGKSIMWGKCHKEKVSYGENVIVGNVSPGDSVIW